MAADRGTAGQAQEGGGGLSDVVTLLGRGLITYFVVSAISGAFTNKGSAPVAPDVDSPAGSLPTPGTPGVVRHNIFRKGQLLDMWLYTSGSPQFLEEDPQLQLLWQEEQIKLCEESHARSKSLAYPLTTALQNNGSAYLHVFFTRTGMPPLPSSPAFAPEAVFGGSYELVKYMKKPKEKVGTNLLASDSAMPPESSSELEEAGQAQPGEIWAHWKPNVTIALVDDFTPYPDPQIPPTVRQRMVLDPYTGNYFPHVWFNDFWLLKEHLMPLNNTLEEVDLHLELTYANLFKWQLLLSVEESFSTQSEFGGMGEKEADTLKRIFIESNPYFLGLTMAVSLLHTVFDMLAFKNDIGFWKNNKSMEGLSARSILINAGCQLVIFLYLLDNETSYTILFSSGIGMLIEFWKVTKAMDVSVVKYKGLPMLKFQDRETYAGNMTKQYDAEASRYLSYVLYPLVIGYAIYTLVYESHRSWYSWVLGSLVGAVYTFGFILMCPQLYLNYKLQSVAHMPWRQMTYKFLNTIMDDLFAFVIKMPLLHRLSVFRDDVIFLIFLYQRWIYRVDKTRVNEFGYSEAAQPQGEGCSIEPDGDKSAEPEDKLLQPAGTVRRRGTTSGGQANEAKGPEKTAPGASRSSEAPGSGSKKAK